ncbi:MAG: DNA polymerase alpha-associated DNA helicase A [Loktanella salsilacus]|jgi:DNA polymerase alpha-associated DNA helicase A|uniref:DEAD/DEAH box helicase n=1 Tax=Loktanella salsilacus TaxID=195913 RepID=UPI00398915EA
MDNQLLHEDAISSRYKMSRQWLTDGEHNLGPHLIPAIGIEDGEHYLLRVYPKTGAAVDEDVRALLSGTLRRIRRVFATARIRDLFVEAIELVSDDTAFAIVLAETGSTLSCLPARGWNELQSMALENSGRAKLWLGIKRIAEALNACHVAGLIHGKIGRSAIFIENGPTTFRLGGYEAAIAISDPNLGNAVWALGHTEVLSFRQDWADLGRLTSEVFNIATDLANSSETRCVMLNAEKQLLQSMLVPPVHRHVDGRAIISDIAAVAEELARIGTSTDSILLAYPDRRVILSDIPSVVSGAIPPDDTNKLLQYVADDLAKSTTRVALTAPHHCDIQLISDHACYDLKRADDRIARIVACRPRASDDHVQGALAIVPQVRVVLNRKEAESECRRTGHGAGSWVNLSGERAENAPERGPATTVWYALVLSEVFSLLSQRFRAYPVTVYETDQVGGLIIKSRSEPKTDAARAELGLQPAAIELAREMAFHDGTIEWTLSEFDGIGSGPAGAPTLDFDEATTQNGERAYQFSSDRPINGFVPRYLRPKPDKGLLKTVSRRLASIVAARDQNDLLRALDDPRRVRADLLIAEIASPGSPPLALDASKHAAWHAITRGAPLNLVVGPPGVGKSFFVSELIASILEQTPDARILVSAQNHEALALMERSLKDRLSAAKRIVVRAERADVEVEDTGLRDNSRRLLQPIAEGDTSSLNGSQRGRINDALQGQSGNERQRRDAAALLRDTDQLVMRAADVTLATTNSYRIEALVSDGEQFDWVIVEEAARASGGELIGPLLLGNRRVLVGDHRQLPPFGAQIREKLYGDQAASCLLRDAVERLEVLTDIPFEICEALQTIRDDDWLRGDVLGTAARLETPFQIIAEREEATPRIQGEETGRPVTMLREQRRMHPAICSLVSNIFYDGALTSSDNIADRQDPVHVSRSTLASPLVLLDLPALSRSNQEAFETRKGTSWVNEAEVDAIITSLREMKPRGGAKATLAILSPYKGQVELLERRLAPSIKSSKDGFPILRGFESAKGDGVFAHTVDGFQGGEADLVIVSLVRNNQQVGHGAVGFLRNRQRLNVLLSRARHKLVLVTSARFLRQAVDGTDPDKLGGTELRVFRDLLDEIDRSSKITLSDKRQAATQVKMTETGEFE